MKNLASVEKLLKRCFKEKVTVTTATMVAFLITGTAVLGATYAEQYTTGDNTIDIGSVLSNGEKDGTVNIWEDPNNNNQVTLTNNGTILQTEGTGKAIAAVNIANAADFTNNGIISVDRGGNDVGSAISQGFGGLVGKSPSTSSSIVNGKPGKIEVKNVAIATGINADGYKKDTSNEGKNDISIKNHGEIKISPLTEKKLTTGELNAWNFLNGSKYKINTITGSGSIGAGVVAGNLVSVENTGNIDIANENPMVMTGTLKNGEIVSTTIGGVGIAAAHDINKSKDGKTRVTVNNSGTINMKGNYMLGIATAGQVDTINSGTVTVAGEQGAGILIGEGGTLKNTGRIIATGEGSKAVLGSSADDAVTLGKGSHIEGIIDLADGNDTVSINGVGTSDTQESLSLQNIENMSIKDSNILFTKDTDLKLVSNTSVTSSKIVNEGSISAAEGTQNLYVLNAQGGDTTITNNGTITSRNGGSGIVIGGINSKIINNGTIDAVGEPSTDREWVSKGINVINSATVQNNGIINVQAGTTSGSAIYTYSGTVTNGKNGEINLLGTNSKGLRIYGGVINGADLSQKREVSVRNEGKITGTNTELRGIEITKIAGKNATIENAGIIQLNGDNSIGISSSRKSDDVIDAGITDIFVTNSGIIELNGVNSTGISAGKGTQAINKGTIALNVFGEGTAYSGNIAMKGEDGAVISSTGTIQLSDITAEKISEDKLAELETFVKDTLMVGGEHTGIITNTSGDTISAAGEEITGDLGDVQEDEVIKTDDTVTVVGGKLDGVLNIGKDFVVEDGKFLAKVESEKLS
ncbi:MAG: beta strand repeat-containing protein, partial [Fusobacteriaceae bacterium]